MFVTDEPKLWFEQNSQYWQAYVTDVFAVEQLLVADDNHDE